MVSFVVKLVEIPLSETMEQERIELLKLEGQINSTNTTHEDRVKLILQLKEKYPGYFDDLDAEKASYDQVKKAIDAVNDSLINRILLQKKQEQIDKAAEEAAKVKGAKMKITLKTINGKEITLTERIKAGRTKPEDKWKPLLEPLAVIQVDDLKLELDPNELTRTRSPK